MILKTKRLILRPPRKSDWKDIVEGVKEIEVSRMLALVPHPYTKKDALWWINDTLKKGKKKKDDYTFFIELKDQKKVIGVTEIRVNRQDKKCGAGSWINKKYWRKGYILEAKIAVFDFAFNKLKLRKVESGAFVENIASNNMQKRLGSKYEGTRRKSHISKATGKIHDENIYGLFKEDWIKVRPKIIKEVERKIKEGEINKI